MNGQRGSAGISLLLVLSGCTGAAESHRAAQVPQVPQLPQVPELPAVVTRPPLALVLRTPANDTGATLAAITAFTQRVDRDTARMLVAKREAELGAGAMAHVTSWRAGGALQRLRVESDGAGFRTSDLYWFSDTTLVAATLESVRPTGRPERERLWFRNGRLYRWIDAEGRVRNPEVRSTQYEVEMFRSRLQQMLSFDTAAARSR